MTIAWTFLIATETNGVYLTNESVLILILIVLRFHYCKKYNRENHDVNELLLHHFFSFDIIFFDIIPIFPGLFSGPIFSKNSCII